VKAAELITALDLPAIARSPLRARLAATASSTEAIRPGLSLLTRLHSSSSTGESGLAWSASGCRRA